MNRPLMFGRAAPGLMLRRVMSRTAPEPDSAKVTGPAKLFRLLVRSRSCSPAVIVNVLDVLADVWIAVVALSEMVLAELTLKVVEATTSLPLSITEPPVAVDCRIDVLPLRFSVAPAFTLTVPAVVEAV